jgi:hypothetical protein
MAKAIIAFSVKLNVMSLRFHAFRKYGEVKLFTMKIATATARSSDSQLFSRRSSGDCRRSGMARVVSVMWHVPRA